jgi:hypothetical protein
VNATAIDAGEVDPHFNNFGGADRFWLGPESGQFGLYFPPGAALTRQTWRVPDAFDRGPFKVVRQEEGKIVFTRDMTVSNYVGQKFTVHTEREIGILGAAALPSELGVELPVGVSYGGAYSLNLIANDGEDRWNSEKGLVGIWILGQFNASETAVVIAPFREGDPMEIGPQFNDDYFGRVSVLTPKRLKVLGNAVLFRADARWVGKFGIGQRRTTGVAGAMDFAKNLLTIVKFDVPPSPERYGNATWVKEQAHPYGGDAFFSYNNGADRPGDVAEAAFFELESASPVQPLGPGESIRHRHATHHFQGDFDELAALARRILGVDLAAVRETMLKG